MSGYPEVHPFTLTTSVVLSQFFFILSSSFFFLFLWHKQLSVPSKERDRETAGSRLQVCQHYVVWSALVYAYDHWLKKRKRGGKNVVFTRDLWDVCFVCFFRPLTMWWVFVHHSWNAPWLLLYGRSTRVVYSLRRAVVFHLLAFVWIRLFISDSDSVLFD